MYRTLTALVAVFLSLSLAAYAKDSASTVHGKYFAPVHVGVYWQNGLTSSSLAVDELLIREIEKAYRKCKRQFNASELNSGRTCEVTVELWAPKPSHIEASADLRFAVRAALWGILAERGVVASDDLTVFSETAPTDLGPHDRAAVYVSGSDGLDQPGLFVHVGKKKLPI